MSAIQYRYDRHRNIKKDKMIFILFLAIICCWPCKSLCADNEMPIIAYWGVPDWKTFDDDFRTFSECGFTVSIYPYKSLEAMVKACRTADKYGVKILGKCPEMASSPQKVALALKKERGFFGYLMKDEPSLPEITQQQKNIELLRSTDSTHLFYINMLPYYADWTLTAAKAKNYEEYIRAASRTSCQQLSFDYYPIVKKKIRDTWYYNLELMRKESLRSGKPFWGFILSVPHVDYPQPTMGSLRLQAYANLAYGAQALQYFTYWTPDASKEYDFHDAPISPQGKKTKTYPLVQAMNNELKVVVRLFYGAKNFTVRHIVDIPMGTTQLTTAPANLSSLKVKGKKGAIVSQFEKDNHLYLAIVNKNHLSTMTVQIKLLNDNPKHITKSLTEEAVKDKYTVQAGDLLLFRLK